MMKHKESRVSELKQFSKSCVFGKRKENDEEITAAAVGEGQILGECE